MSHFVTAQMKTTKSKSVILFSSLQALFFLKALAILFSKKPDALGEKLVQKLSSSTQTLWKLSLQSYLMNALDCNIPVAIKRTGHSEVEKVIVALHLIHKCHVNLDTLNTMKTSYKALFLSEIMYVQLKSILFGLLINSRSVQN